MRKLKTVVLEALVLAAAGLLLALAANALSPRGLKLGRNYFPALASTPAKSGSSSGKPAESSLAVRLQRHGLNLVLSNEVAQLFHDPAYEQGLVVFVDARNDHAYQAGHVPGAWQLDYYRAENYLSTVFPVCSTAQKVIVYCNGGSCDDSELAAVMLRDAGIPASNLFVYGGGISEWTNALPIEIGPRGSGQIINPRP